MTHESYLDIQIKKLKELKERARSIKVIRRCDRLIEKFEGWKNEIV